MNRISETEWKCGKCDGMDVPEHSRRCRERPFSIGDTCILCNEPFISAVRYYTNEGWGHWHCVMNKLQNYKQAPGPEKEVR